jgi:hypothetical protein
MRKTSMTGDHPRQIRVIASSGAKLRTEEEEELMPFEGAMQMPTDRNVSGRELEESAKCDG